MWSAILMVCLIVAFLSGIWLLIIAFSEDILCGCLFLILPFYQIFYIITRWSKCRTPAILSIISCIGLVICAIKDVNL